MSDVKRFTFLRGVFFCGFAVLLFFLAGMQLFRGNRFIELSRKNCIKLIPQPGARGSILDRNGTVLAGNVLSYDVMVLPQKNTRIGSSSFHNKMQAAISRTTLGGSVE